MEKKNNLVGWIFFAIAILVGVTIIWIKAGWTGNRIENSTLLMFLFLMSFAFNARALVAKHRNEKHVRMLNYEVKVANRLLRVSIAEDDTGVRKALDREARELNNAFAAENSFQQLNQSVQDKDEKFIPWAKARDEARVTKMNFWALVNKAKDLGLEVPDGVEFRNFIIKTKI